MTDRDPNPEERSDPSPHPVPHGGYVDEDGGDIADDIIRRAATAQNPGMELRRLVELLTRRSYSSPLPPPEILEGYESVFPGAGAVVFDEFQAQARHRRLIERQVIMRREVRADRGQLFALVIAVAALIGSVICILAHQPWAGVTLFGGSLVAIVAAFLRSTSREERELSERRPTDVEDDDDESPS